MKIRQIFDNVNETGMARKLIYRKMVILVNCEEK